MNRGFADAIAVTLAFREKSRELTAELFKYFAIIATPVIPSTS